ncbi:hypothetical protein AB4Z46_16575 [Variovorax sp. M-6]|uniref:hypothetical protein n=1 Tax=Variovorax sp. M-6 TaxID=3233041 RepID=UPI003F98D9BA
MKSRLRTWSSTGLLRCRWGVLGAGLLGAAVAFASSLVDISAPAGPYSLKGFAPGQAMADCPVQWEKYRNDAGFSCIQHGGKLASRPIQATFLRIESGKLLSVWIDLKDPGDWVHVQSALTQKYGRPAFDQGASRAWATPDAQLSVGNSGGVLLLGSWKARQGAPEASVDL